MAKIQWGASGQRFYEAGVDRGVLYIDTAAGIPWDGLISVNESASDHDVTPHYIDGVKYLQTSVDKEFKVSLEAYYSPDAFDLCDGTSMVRLGLYATQQPRKSFNLSYRTKIGNDAKGLDRGYKIHLVYNAMAVPNDRSYKSIGDSADTTTFGWDITTIPKKIPEIARYSSHLIIDTTMAYDWAITALENILYGTDTVAPRMPTPQEVVNLFEDNSILKITDNGDGTWTAETTNPTIITMLDATTFQIDWPSAVYIDAVTYTIRSL